MPAAAVIPAPIAYIKVVAVKKFVVEILQTKSGRPFGVLYLRFVSIILSKHRQLCSFRVVTLRKLECLKQAKRLEYSSME